MCFFRATGSNAFVQQFTGKNIKIAVVQNPVSRFIEHFNGSTLEPAWYLCNFCEIDFIVKMEQFQEEANYLLRKRGVEIDQTRFVNQSCWPRSLLKTIRKNFAIDFHTFGYH